jgi:hypothetical protein
MIWTVGTGYHCFSSSLIKHRISIGCTNESNLNGHDRIGSDVGDARFLGLQSCQEPDYHQSSQFV